MMTRPTGRILSHSANGLYTDWLSDVIAPFGASLSGAAVGVLGALYLDHRRRQSERADENSAVLVHTFQTILVAHSTIYQCSLYMHKRLLSEGRVARLNECVHTFSPPLTNIVREPLIMDDVYRVASLSRTMNGSLFIDALFKYDLTFKNVNALWQSVCQIRIDIVEGSAAANNVNHRRILERADAFNKMLPILPLRMCEVFSRLDRLTREFRRLKFAATELRYQKIDAFPHIFGSS